MNPTWERAPTQNEIAVTQAVVLSMCHPIVWIGPILFIEVEEFA